MGDAFNEKELTENTREYYERFLKAGGQSKLIKKWLEDHPVATDDAGKKGKKEVIMVCPECGSLGKKGLSVCNRDGAELVPKE
jgi:hypothetical protein